jgi:hypothetical protein
MHIFRHIFLSNYWWQKSYIWSQASYRYPISWEAFLDPSNSYFLFTYMKLVTKYQISVINSCWEKCDEKCAYMFNVYKNQLSRQTGSSNLTGSKTLPTIWHRPVRFLLPVCRLSWLLYTFNIYAHFSSHFSQKLLMTGIWYFITSFISVPHIVLSVFGPIRFLLPVCRLGWFLYTLNIYVEVS